MKTVQELEAEIAELRKNQQPSNLTVSKDRLREWRGPSTCTLVEWQAEALAAVAEYGMNHKPEEAAGYLTKKIKGDAAKEVRLEKDQCSKSPESLFEVLFEAYGSGKSATTLTREFYNRKQRATEKVLAYSHALGDVMDELQEVDKTVDQTKREVMLQKQLAENVINGQLRWELQKELDKDPTITFVKLRKVAMKYEADEDRVAQRSTMLDEHTTAENMNMKKRVSEMEHQLARQQENMKVMVNTQSQLMERMAESFERACGFATSMASQVPPPSLPPTQYHGPPPQFQGQQRYPQQQQPYPHSQYPQSYGNSNNYKKRLRCHWCRELGHFKKECEGYIAWKVRQPAAENVTDQ